LYSHIQENERRAHFLFLNTFSINKNIKVGNALRYLLKIDLLIHARNIGRKMRNERTIKLLGCNNIRQVTLTPKEFYTTYISSTEKGEFVTDFNQDAPISIFSDKDLEWIKSGTLPTRLFKFSLASIRGTFRAVLFVVLAKLIRLANRNNSYSNSTEFDQLLKRRIKLSKETWIKDALGSTFVVKNISRKSVCEVMNLKQVEVDGHIVTVSLTFLNSARFLATIYNAFYVANKYNRVIVGVIPRPDKHHKLVGIVNSIRKLKKVTRKFGFDEDMDVAGELGLEFSTGFNVKFVPSIIAIQIAQTSMVVYHEISHAILEDNRARDNLLKAIPELNEITECSVSDGALEEIYCDAFSVYLYCIPRKLFKYDLTHARIEVAVSALITLLLLNMFTSKGDQEKLTHKIRAEALIKLFLSIANRDPYLQSNYRSRREKAREVVKAIYFWDYACGHIGYDKYSIDEVLANKVNQVYLYKPK
jgi:hypothetical protein